MEEALDLSFDRLLMMMMMMMMIPMPSIGLRRICTIEINVSVRKPFWDG